MKISNQKFLFQILFFFILIFILGCQNDEKKAKNIEIDLIRSNEISFYDNSKSQFLLLSTSQINPEFYNQNLEIFEGIPELDSFEILTENVNNFRFYRSALFREKYRKEFLRDSLLMKMDNSKSFINVLSGFKENEQILILDSNNNYNFSDDKVLRFPNDYRLFKNNAPRLNDSLLKIDSLSTLNLNFILQSDNDEVAISRKVQLFPIANFYYTQLMGENRLKEFAAIIRFKDGLKGDFKINGEKFQTYIQGVNKESSSILIVPDNYQSFQDSEVFQQNFLYNLTDTIQLIDQLFTLNFNLSQSHLELKNLDSIPPKSGYRIGNRIKNFKFESLDNNSFRIDSLFQNKKYLLIDFWGTWCKPCKELTPELVSISRKYRSELNILSVARDESVEVVKKYVAKNDMNWYHSFIEKDNQDEILNELNIKSYPTFLLVNKNRDIIFRGGSNSLVHIKNLISDNQ